VRGTSTLAYFASTSATKKSKFLT